MYIPYDFNYLEKCLIHTILRQISGNHIDIDMYINIHPNITVHAVVHFQCSKTIFSV